MKKHVVFVLCATFGLVSMSYSQASFAKRTPEEQAAKDAAKAAKDAAKNNAAASTRVRLDANFEADPAVETDAEYHAKFRNDGGKIRLDAEASGFPDGTMVQVFVGNIKIGVITVLAGEGEISFRDAATWPVGLPMDLKAGTMVRFLDMANKVLAEGPFVAK